ncbi:condensation domain-containing protein [Bradyrhizobium sp. B120]|uniref:condensation domain-containing protein n=1 Tax=Bradyrhizobium sp. B120 TaxID=3410088 RepID=UPI003B97F4FB
MSQSLSSQNACDLLQGPVLAEHLEFWKRYLKDAPRTLELPTDRPRLPIANHRGGCVSFELGAQLSMRLRQFSQHAQVTLLMTRAAAFNVLLHRYSGQDDVCVGYFVGNRNRVETEGLIGAFVNTLVLRAPLLRDQTFATHLARVRDSLLEADAHQDLPFEKLVEELSPERDPSRHPLQVTFSYSTTHDSRSKTATMLPGLGEKKIAFPGLAISLVEPEYNTAKFDLSLFISETEAMLAGDLEYASDSF